MKTPKKSEKFLQLLNSLINLINHFYKKQKKLFYLIVFLVFVAVLFFFKKHLFFIIVFVIINFILGLIIRGPIRMIAMGVELVTFSSVLCGAVFGPNAGLIMGLTGSTALLFSQKYNLLYRLIFIPLYGIFGFVSGYFSSANIFIVGMTFSLIYGVISSTFVFFAFEGRISKCIWFIITNLAFNWFVFSTFGSLALKIMS